jgi:hypothetical protein
MANLADDLDVLELARDAGVKLMNDPEDSREMTSQLQERFERFFGILFTG